MMQFSPKQQGLKTARRALAAVAVAFGSMGALAAPVQAVVPAPAWRIVSKASPSHFAPGSEGIAFYSVRVENTGAVASDGSPVTIVDELPEQLALAPESIAAPNEKLSADSEITPEGRRSPQTNQAVCHEGRPASCTISSTVVRPGEALVMYVPLKVEGKDGETVVNHVRVTGGGVPAASAAEQATISSEPAPFGFQSLTSVIDDASGAPESRAGAHPYALQLGFELTTRYSLASILRGGPSGSAGSPRTVRAVLPQGLVVDPQATPTRCTETQLEAERCPEESVVGNARLMVTLLNTPALAADPGTPLYNMVPPPGVPAELAFEAVGYGFPVHLLGGVDSSGNYALTAEASELLQYGGAVGATVELWGNPSDPSHDFVRGRCANLFIPKGSEGCTVGASEVPFLTLPSACSAPLSSNFSVESWQEPGKPISASVQTSDSLGNPVGVSDCGKLEFNPSIEARPETSAGDAPTGLHVGLHLPQHQGQETLATADLKDVSVTLPEGLAVNPSAADGLGACSQAQVGYEGLSEGRDVFSGAPAQCPDAAKLGTVEVDTPLLEKPLFGSLYLAKQKENPSGSLIGLYLAIDDPATGVVVKLAGRVDLNPLTGRLTATFRENPELPFEQLKVELFGGARAPLTTPLGCGSYTTTSDLTPWSSPQHADAFPTDSFSIDSGCASSEAQAPNAPSFEAGTVTPLAGSYSSFVLNLARANGSQRLQALNVDLPEGLLGKLAGVQLCSEAQIAAAQARGNLGEGALERQTPSCPQASEIGTVNVGAGSGSPLYVQGHAYLAGPYEGAPFSLVFVTPAVAGPFDLGTVVVRAGLYIDSHTARVSVKSDPIPTILQGIPLDIRSIAVNVNRSGFVLNPTSCEAMSVGGQAISKTGAVASLSGHFQVGGCQGLAFKPSFTASTSAHVSRASGASLNVKVAYPARGQADIAKVKVQLPKQLPSRLSTLQKACTEKQFAANPAGCPAGSRVGTATAVTPLLNAPLSGPAYFVSHGGAKFPELIMVLQGEGVTIDLAGETFISKSNVTTSTFNSVPDAPISSFEVRLPQGGDSALAAPAGKLCQSNLIMPTTITAHNGAVITQNTKIAVQGCPKAQTLTQAQRLKAALSVCHKDKGKGKREKCERKARARYATKATTKTTRSK